MSGFKLLLAIIASFSVVTAIPIVFKGSSPSGDTSVIAISSTDPNVEKYLTFNFPSQADNSERLNTNPSDLFQKTFSTALAGTHTSTGRGFSSFNPFLLPFFNFPLNFEGLNFGPWLRGVESHDSFGNREVKTVTAVNDNGHVYGKINGVSFDNVKTKQHGT